MRFTRDPNKSDANLRGRGLDFAYAARIFDGRTLDRLDARREYGERRMIATGVVADIELTVCYTDRINRQGETERRIISARRSSHHERHEYRIAGEAQQTT